jgi:hypothetical protein
MAALRATEETGEPPADAEGELVGGLASMAPGTEAYFEVDLSAGRYVLLCFVTSPVDGRSHIAHGMIQLVEVG